MRFKKLLAALDFSPLSDQAFHTAAAMAADTGAQLVLLHVLQNRSGEELPSYRSHQIMPQHVAAADAKLAERKREANQLGAHLVSTRVEHGSPWYEIVDLLRQDRSFDLVVIGTHGRTGLKHVLLGSVAEKVVQHAPCPVLVVRIED
jgi:nucleotide-binding universal stress UspA family protein